MLLDHWDYQVITYLKKSEKPSIKGLKEIWAKRVCMDVQHIHLSYIVEHFLVLVERLKLASLPDLVKRSSPTERWKFGHISEEGKDQYDSDFHIIWMNVLAGVLYMAYVDDLPGYREYLDSLT